ncbi:hypothetical protein N8I77_013019 [Diaporthe amygdali]|uniref:NADPH--hemoprotein reductase n=1 Tax=Phomopsis amygdali TaxID=1214568 RepID=A0AAD9VZB5_PHOAM|nr:hypothetical protein N8I77_013019 [Diaporthe amygdali]
MADPVFQFNASSFANTFFQRDALPVEVAEVLKQLAPSSFADTAALATVGLVSSAYLLRRYTWDKPDPYGHIFYERPQAQEGFLSKTKTTRNIAERLEELNKDAVVFWGSQSGTAEGFANRLARELHQRLGLDALSADLSDFDSKTIALIPQSKIAIFILSTYGEGDPSDNAGPFWDWLNKLVDSSALSSLRYAAFGLGNTQYRYYNRVVDVVDEGLQKAGAERLLDVGRADDAAGATEEDFLAWKDDLFTFFVKKLGMKQHEVKYEPQLSVVQDDSLDLSDLHLGEPLRSTDKGSSEIRPLKIRSSRELFSNTSRNCLHLDLDLTEHPQITYKTGDHLAVWAMNPDEEVERLLTVLGLTERRSAPLLVQALDKSVKVPVPSPTSIESVLRHYLEICAPISRDAVKALAQFAPTEAAKTFLTALSEDRTSFAQFIADKHLNLGRLLEMSAQQEPGAPSPWTSLPLSFLIETLPKMQPRYYSISSSSVISPRAPSITALVSSTPVATSKSQDTSAAAASIPGLATNYLLGLSHSLAATTTAPSPAHPAGLSYALSGPEDALAGGKLYAHMRRSKFKLPAQPSHPLVMVAAGTGLAPFRAFVAERARMRQIGKEVGEMVLFFGCRRAHEDYIYREELESFERELGGQLRIVTAFSREEDSPKMYVQDRVQELGADVVRLVLDGGASVYMCGRASMAREVGGVLGELVGEEKGWGREQVKEWTERMKRNRTWQEDVWG